MRKTTVGILFGGRSAEHEVSIRSAKTVADALDRSKYNVVAIKIGKDGKWSLEEGKKLLNDPYQASNDANYQKPHKSCLCSCPVEISALPAAHCLTLIGADGIDSNGKAKSVNVDVVFPVLHGPYGEDGTVQGFLKLADIPYIGPDVLGSSISMDKDVTKRLLGHAKIPIAPFVVLDKHSYTQQNVGLLLAPLGMPLFVKPANLGSSVGISKVHNETELEAAIKKAFCYDKKIIIEKGIIGREIECAVIGNEDPLCSIPGEIIPGDDFYSYDAKYSAGSTSDTIIPAKLSQEEIQNAQALAIQTYKVLNCEGLSRVDLFLQDDGTFLVNEINTLPGFTSISMFPKLWEASGTPLPDLLDKLIEYAIQRHKRDSQLG